MAEKEFDIILFYSLKAGNEDALDLLFKKYYENLCNYVATIINDFSLCEDIVTELFADIWLKRSKIIITHNFRAYIYKSAKNAALTYLRKKKLVTVSFEDVSVSDIVSYQTPFAEAKQKQADKNVSLILQQIPPRSRQVFVLHRFEEMKYKEISEFLSISIKTVENHISTALKILRSNKDFIRKILNMVIFIMLYIL